MIFKYNANVAKEYGEVQQKLDRAHNYRYPRTGSSLGRRILVLAWDLEMVNNKDCKGTKAETLTPVITVYVLSALNSH